MFGSKQAVVEVRRGVTLEREQSAALTRPHGTRRKTCGLGVGGPFLGIDIHHVEDAAHALGMHHIARHGGRKDEDAIDGAGCQLGIDPALQAAIVEIAQRQRFAMAQPERRFQVLDAGVEWDAAKICAMRPQLCEMHLVRGVIDETAEMHAMRAREVTEDVPRADLVALVGREWDPVCEVEKILHNAQPSPRTIGGPSRFATGNGRRFQAAMNSRYFGLSGLWSGIVAPGARR